MKSTNEVLGLLHASYGLGATISPLIITAMLETYHLPWWTYYYIMISVTIVNIIANTSVRMKQDRHQRLDLFPILMHHQAFWAESGKEFRRKNAGGEGDDKGRNRQAVRTKITWICAGFLLFYVGTEVSLGGKSKTSCYLSG